MAANPTGKPTDAIAPDVGSIERNVVDLSRSRTRITWAILAAFAVSAVGMALASTLLPPEVWSRAATSYNVIFTVLTGLAGSAIGFYLRDTR